MSLGAENDNVGLSPMTVAVQLSCLGYLSLCHVGYVCLTRRNRFWKFDDSIIGPRTVHI